MGFNGWTMTMEEEGRCRKHQDPAVWEDGHAAEAIPSTASRKWPFNIAQFFWAVKLMG